MYIAYITGIPIKEASKMTVQLPPKSILSKSLALKACEAAETLTKSQICDCIEVLSGVTLSRQEKQQSKTALLQVLSASAQMQGK